MRGLGISEDAIRQIVGVRGSGPYLGPNGSPLSAPDFNELNAHWDRYRGATSFIGASGPYAWMNTAASEGGENPVDKRAWNYLNDNWGIIRTARYFTDINWGDPRLVGLPDYYYELYPQAMAADPLPEVGPAAPAPATPAPLVTSPNFVTSSGGGGYMPYFSSEPLPDSLMPNKPATGPVQAGLFSNLFSKVPPWALALMAAGLALPIILGKSSAPRRRRRR